jgi:hypothetical protein
MLRNLMDDLIEALQIFRKYSNERWPTHCEHDVLYIMGVDRADVLDEDNARLKELGFEWFDDEEVYISYRFGSA